MVLNKGIGWDLDGSVVFEVDDALSKYLLVERFLAVKILVVLESEFAFFRVWFFIEAVLTYNGHCGGIQLPQYSCSNAHLVASTASPPCEADHIDLARHTECIIL